MVLMVVHLLPLLLLGVLLFARVSGAKGCDPTVGLSATSAAAVAGGEVGGSAI
jgi:hypothetical protein